MSFLQNLVSALGGRAIEYFNERQKLRHDLKIAQLNSEIAAEQRWAEWRVKNIDADAAWEDASIKNSGWKDEYVLGLISTPYWMAFIPALVPYVHEGFSALEQTPEWYRWLTVMIFAATYGIRLWRRKI